MLSGPRPADQPGWDPISSQMEEQLLGVQAGSRGGEWPGAEAVRTVVGRLGQPGWGSREDQGKTLRAPSLRYEESPCGRPGAAEPGHGGTAVHRHMLSRGS